MSQKFSRFMFHLKFSNTDDYVHEHELYEVMRSRNLYQTQFGVRSNFKNMMRKIAKDEKQTRYGFENTRKLFVQKMKERREQIDKLRDRTEEKLKSLSQMDGKPKKLERRYVPLPQSTIVYTDLPPIAAEQQGIPAAAQSTAESHAPYPDDTTILPPAPSPSMVATVYTEEGKRKKRKGSQDITNTIAHSLAAAKTSPRTISTRAPKSKLSSREKGRESDDKLGELIEHGHLDDQMKGLVLDPDKNEEYVGKKDNWEFETNTKLGEGKAQVSTVFFTDEIPIRNRLRRQRELMGDSKAKIWAEKHGVVESRANVIKEADFQRLLIDRPSKWALNNFYGEMVQSKILDMRLQYSRKLFNQSFKRKSRQLDHLSEKLNLKHRISLPELNTAPKPMASLDPGGTTPDGKLILTKADYEGYLSGYKKARSVRLDRSRKRNKVLDKRIDNFRLEPTLCLRDETSLRASFKTV